MRSSLRMCDGVVVAQVLPNWLWSPKMSGWPRSPPTFELVVLRQLQVSDAGWSTSRDLCSLAAPLYHVCAPHLCRDTVGV